MDIQSPYHSFSIGGFKICSRETTTGDEEIILPEEVGVNRQRASKTSGYSGMITLDALPPGLFSP